MRTHLERGGADAEDVEQAIAALIAEGYLDDARFARLFVQDKRELERWGSDRIRQALLARGIDGDLINDALVESDRDGDGEGTWAAGGSGGEIDRALAILRRRFPSLGPDRRDRERALGVLLRKGYDVDLALEAIALHASV